MTAPTSPTGIERHPDLVELRARSERVASSFPAQAAEALAVVTGLYLTISPWVVGFNDLQPLAVNNLITGIAYTLCVAWFGAYERTHAMSWAAAGIGVWTIISPWAMAGDVDITRTIINNTVAGSIALLLALAISSLAAAARLREAMGGAYGPGARTRGAPGA
ncbi:SPW repeat protein [Streptomyces sp. KR80]|uniref:SPW repeat protein n=1 Tax=Streptomyces sp. KR80 TaxID=3457426 RepID=UPI003FD5273F